MPLSDEALVVRGGSTRDAEDIQDKVLAAVEDGDGPLLSVWCTDIAPGETRDQALSRLCTEADFPHKKVQVGTLGSVRAAVAGLYQDSSEGEPESHYHVLFTEDVTLSEVEVFISSLGDPEPNPTGGKP